VRPDVLVVLPTYDEAENISAIVDAVLPYGVWVLIVDDASPDGTGEIADRIAAAEERVSVLHRPSKQGLGPAYAAGFAAAADRPGIEIVVEMDADFSHDPADLPRLIAAVDGGADLAIGSRYVPGGRVEDWGWHRRLLSWGGNRYAALLLGTHLRDMTAGYRAFRLASLQRLDPAGCEAHGYGFQVEMAWRAVLAGMSVAEVPVVFRDRRLGRSKMVARIAVEAMARVTRWGLARMAGRLPWRPEEV
jgi:dolichol-phosphate mannosyltransferase